jgi:hypothetical protein
MPKVGKIRKSDYSKNSIKTKSYGILKLSHTTTCKRKTGSEICRSHLEVTRRENCENSIQINVFTKKSTAKKYPKN